MNNTGWDEMRIHVLSEIGRMITFFEKHDKEDKAFQNAILDKLTRLELRLIVIETRSGVLGGIIGGALSIMAYGAIELLRN